MKWTFIDVVHWFGGAYLLLGGLMTEFGIQLPGMVIDPKIAIPAGGAVIAAGLKAGITSGK